MYFFKAKNLLQTYVFCQQIYSCHCKISSYITTIRIFLIYVNFIFMLSELLPKVTSLRCLSGRRKCKDTEMLTLTLETLPCTSVTGKLITSLID